MWYNESAMENFDLFSTGAKKMAPLADRMRPETLGEFFGQEHITARNKLLYRAILTDTLGSCIFYGPPGCGKTSLANIIAKTARGHFEKLNAVSAGVADVKKIVTEAADRLRLYGQRTYLLLDECHRFNKAQSDSLLPAIEDGTLIFIGSTTENPYISMTPAIVSRCAVYEFRRLDAADIEVGLRRAIADRERGLGNLRVRIDDDALHHLADAAAGDLRAALNGLERAALSTQPEADGTIHIDLDTAENSIQRKALSLDETLYYDILSAFCKSLRGSDATAALYYAERLIESGCDPLKVIRRLVVHAAEDVGMAEPNALVMAVSALTAFEKLGLPEGLIPLAEAIIYVCEAPKSNAVVRALAMAKEDAVRHPDDNIPLHLRDRHYKGAENRTTDGYIYVHDVGGWAEQQYLPDSLKDRCYYQSAFRYKDRAAQEGAEASGTKFSDRIPGVGKPDRPGTGERGKGDREQ